MLIIAFSYFFIVKFFEQLQDFFNS